MLRETLPKSRRRQCRRRTQVRNMSDSRGLGNFANTGFIALFGGRFSRGGNILSARALQDFLGFLGPLRSVRMNRKQNPSIFDAAFVSLGFVLRDSHADQRTRKAAHRSTDSGACCGTFRRFGAFIVSKILRASALGKKY